MVILELLSPKPLTAPEDGQRIFRLWGKYLPDLLSECYGNWEPIDRSFAPDKLDSALEHWKWPFFARRRVPSVDFSVLMRKSAKQQLHATLILRLDTATARQTQLLEFLRAASLEVEADFACLNLLTVAELQRGRANRTVTPLGKKGEKLRFFIASHDLQERLPDLYWATVLGGPYLSMFGRDRMLSAPAFRAEPLGDQAVLLQMTEDLSDVERQPAKLEDVRSRAKEHLGKDAFFQPGITSYRTPRFVFA